MNGANNPKFQERKYIKMYFKIKQVIYVCSYRSKTIVQMTPIFPPFKYETLFEMIHIFMKLSHAADIGWYLLFSHRLEWEPRKAVHWR